MRAWCIVPRDNAAAAFTAGMRENSVDSVPSGADCSTVVVRNRPCHCHVYSTVL